LEAGNPKFENSKFRIQKPKTKNRIYFLISDFELPVSNFQFRISFFELLVSALKTRCDSEPFAVILSAAKDLALVRDEARTKRSERDSSLRSG
jgi:hypothetical protein